MSRLLDNLAVVRQRIAAAARRSGRSPDAVTLVAVTKYVTDEVVYDLVKAGCHDLGEARPQELWRKAAALSRSLEQYSAGAPTVRWHLIGHLQRNKVEPTLPLVSLVHSGDSMRLLKAIDAVAAEQVRRTSVLIEVNVSGDATKHGFAPEEIEEALPTIAALDHVDVRGLMCMAAREGDEAISRRNFSMLREIRERLQSQQAKWENISLDEISMGMSDDFEIAIEEGASMVRVGSALFEGVAQRGGHA